LADALFWLQLGWIVSGFLLMAYLALKVFPLESRTNTSPPPPLQSTAGASQLITVGGYRVEIPIAGCTDERSGVVEARQTPDPVTG
jgi:hypothetical protein